MNIVVSVIDFSVIVLCAQYLELSRLVEAHGAGGCLKAVGGGIVEAVCGRKEREPG